MIETSAHKELLRRVSSWAAKLHLSPKAVKFRVMPQKWGTCSSGGTVTLADDLVDQKARFQDFVIVHELVHLKVSQHGRVFNALMSSHLPGWQAMEKLRLTKLAVGRTPKRSKARRHTSKRSRFGHFRRKLLARRRRTRARLHKRRRG